MMKQLLTLIVFILFSSASVAACDSASNENFDSFFSKWSKIKAFAVKRTLFPIKSITYSNAGTKDESVPILAEIEKAQFQSNQPLSEFISEHGLAHQTSAASENFIAVKISKPDTDWLLEYRFKSVQGCWFFYEVEDFSTYS